MSSNLRSVTLAGIIAGALLALAYPAQARSGPYGPAQIRHAYGIDQLIASGTDGTGQVIAIVEPYGNALIQQSLNIFSQTYGLPNTTIQIVGNNVGGTNRGTMHVEWAHALAPGAKILLSVAPSNSLLDLLAAVDAAVEAGATVISMSWGVSEFAEEAQFDFHFKVPGVTFTASSLDTGSTSLVWPAASPYVLSVGSTSLYLDADGNRSSEWAYSWSGGGRSRVYSQPAWQGGWFQNGWPSMRGVPDVAFVGASVLWIYEAIDGKWYEAFDPSAPAAHWAALIALANQLRGTNGSLSTPNSLIYALAQGSASTPFTINPLYFLDITLGNNGPDPDNSAAFPYDLATGLGTPVAPTLVPALAFGDDFMLAMTPASQTIDPGQGASYTVSVTPVGSFSGDVYLAVSGLPAGCGASFDSNPVAGGSGTSLLTITTANGVTPPGTFELTVTGTNGAFSHGTSATLTVRPPDFSIGVSSASQTAKQGASAQYTVSISPISGFVGNVNLGVSGLPTGATFGFSPNPVSGGSGSSVLTVTTAASTLLGKFNLTITGTSGLLSHSVNVTLNVARPDFALSIGPASRTVFVGNGTNYTLSVSPVGSFTADVALSIAGVPVGATASFDVNPVSGGSGTSVLTVNTTPAIVPGKYTMTITGTGASKTHSVKATLNVPVPDFALSVNPISRTVARGSTTTYTAKVTAKNGFAGTVGLSVTGLPANTSAGFNPPTIAASGSSTLTITAAAATPTGTNQLSVVATSSLLIHSKPATLIVK